MDEKETKYKCTRRKQWLTYEWKELGETEGVLGNGGCGREWEEGG